MIENTVPEGTTSEDKMPEDATPSPTTSEENEAVNTIQESEPPAVTVPAETTPAITIPEDTMTEDKVAQTMNTLKILIEKGWTASAIAKESGINPLTIGNIKNGKSKGISDRVFSSIYGLRENFEAGKVEMPVRKRRGPSVKGKKATTPSKKSTRKPKSKPKLTDLDREIAQIEKQIEDLTMLEKKLDYLKKVKALQEEYRDVI